MEDEDGEESCLFKGNEQINTCSPSTKSGKPLKILSKGRLESVKKQSRKRKDKLHSSLDLMSSPHRRKLKYHEACISTYTSKWHINRRKRQRKKSESNEPCVKRVHRSSTVETFNWKEDCLFCAKPCKIEKDPKHPDRWEEAYLCRTSERSNIGREQYKKTLLDICDKRGDEWAEQVRIRLNDSRALSDLHAADGRYHEKCRKLFTNALNVSISGSKGRKNVPTEKAFTDLIDKMVADKTIT